MAPIQVIGAGLGRTGTDSLKTALNILGYNTHHLKCLLTDPTLNHDAFFEAYVNRETADWDQLYANYDAAVDFSAATFYYDLHKKYPEAKVLLTVRSADSWYNSVKNTIFRTASQFPMVNEGDVGFSVQRLCAALCMDGHIFNPELFLQEEKLKKMYTDHIADVKARIPADQLLVLELGEGWERLCEFLGKDVPEVPYPTSNSTAEFIEYFINENRPDNVIPISTQA
ncbi:hypothetical protein HPULCUR_005119 [Helicostylum pulchrum]|uniref:P-loop containing nucleoside triphosphate hydrolase protein n=1 Tax=Helicostylum pulchrum TaxID=562976 RepID=A0ABP9Y094_9FUNG